MAIRLSLLLDHLGFFDPDIHGLPVHGASLTISALVRAFCADPDVEALEAFIPPGVMAHTDALAQAAERALPPHLRGRGRLRFYPLHSLPDVWADAHPRILLAIDAELMARTRYLRDRYAVGPTPVCAITHALGHHRLWAPMQRLAAAPPVPYDSIACISASVRAALEKVFGGFLQPEGSPLPCRLDFLPHSVDLEQFHPRSDADKRALRRRLGLPEEGTISLFLGRVTPAAKADLLPLVTAFAGVAGPDDHLLVAGAEGLCGYHERLRAAATQAGLGDRYISREDVPPAGRSQFFGAADLFVFPADCIQECQATTVLEAMASGLPVVCSDWDGMRDMVRHGETGYLLPTWLMPCQERLSGLSPASGLATDYLLMAQTVWVDTEALATALQDLLASSRQRAAMGAAARAVAEREYAWTRLRPAWHTVWGEMLEEAEREAPEAARRRRDHAARLGLPTPYLDLFDHYASGVFHAETQAFRLTAAGRAVASGKEGLAFYDDTLALLHRDVLDVLLAETGAASEHGIVLSDLTGRAQARTGKDGDTVRFHVALLLKRGAITPCRPPAERA